MLELRGADYFQARQWLQEFKGPPLRSGDALHLAMAKRQNLTIASADQGLAKVAEALGLPCQLIADQVVSRLLRDALSGEGDRAEAGSVLVAGFRPFGAANPKLVTNEQIDQLRDQDGL